MKRLTIASAVLLLMAGSSAVQAQDLFSLDLRGGASYPTADLGQTSLKLGGGFGVTASLRVMQHVRIYGGWDWSLFKTDGAFEGSEYDVNPNGYAFGLQFQHPIVNSTYGWLRGGALYNHIELEDNDGGLIDSGHEFGWEVGTGVRLPVGERFALTPGLRYRSLSADLPMTSTNKVAVDMNFVSAEIGLSYSFGVSQVAAAIRR